MNFVLVATTWGLLVKAFMIRLVVNVIVSKSVNMKGKAGKESAKPQISCTLVSLNFGKKLFALKVCLMNGIVENAL
jgi:hypothetical protein